MRLSKLLNKNESFSFDRIAFIEKDEEINFSEFINRVNAITAKFQELNISHNDRIMICSQKTVLSVAFIYACIMNGIVFMPVDYKNPIERIKYIVSDSSPKAVLLNKEFAESVGIDFLKNTIDFLFSFDEGLDNDGDVQKISFEKSELNDCNTFNETTEFSESDIAYIIYTSGSTGTPKGVAMSREAIASFLESSIDRASYTADIRFLNFFPFHFDPMLMEILMPWIVGGTVIIYNNFFFINEFVKKLKKYEITDFSCTPNIISLLVSGISRYRKNSWDSLRSIWFGGESANIKHLAEFLKITPHVQLYNGYGPTEATVACSLHKIKQEDLDKDILSIGLPMNEVEFRIFNDEEEIFDDNEEGELYIGGKQLMEGYWGKLGNLEDNGFAIIDSKKYYKSGDIVVKKNGEYYFLGRKNNMIKLRGYRIYPQEVEKAIMAGDTHIKDAVVFLNEDDTILVAAVEVPDITVWDRLEESLKDIIKKSLPDYMVPEKVFYYEKLPRLTNSKLDIENIKRITLGEGCAS